MGHRIIRKPKGIGTITEMFELTANRLPDKEMARIRRGNGWVSYTYGQALQRVRKIAEFLQKEFGIKRGDFVALVGENRPEWGQAYLGILWAGATVIPLDARLNDMERRYLLDFADVKYVIASGRYVPEMLEARKDLGLKGILSMDEHEELPSFATLDERYSGIDRTQVSPEDLAEVLFTSGTTGSPKGVMLTHRNIMSDIEGVYQVVPIYEEDIFFSILPLHHVYECTVGFLSPIYIGATVSYSRSLRPDHMLQDMRDTRPTVWLTVPLILEKILTRILREVSKSPITRRAAFNALRATSKIPLIGRKVNRRLFKPLHERLGLDRLKFMVSGGAALPLWVARGLEELGFKVIQGYGLSETSPILTVTPPHDPRLPSVGVPIPGVEIKIFDPNEEGEGEIAARGPVVMKGYYKNDKANAEVFTEDGWFLTGDIGYLDDDGYLYITGRKKAVIVTKGGKNIYPEEIESKILESPFVEEILVFGAKNPDTGDEEVQALVYPNLDAVRDEARKRGVKPNDDFIYDLIASEIERLSKELAPYKRIKRFALRYEEFPKTTTRKIKRHLFKGMYIAPGEKVKDSGIEEKE
ncbi:MAG: long-chain fatty acid--CoA ligase [Thermotogae bacterium]|nr:long-chain fatty acid--CoA ligase [Thermotogota bacterium]